MQRMAEVDRKARKRIRTMSEQGVRWLVGLEGGVKLRAYLDAGGIPTVGVGQTTLMCPGGERRVTLADRFASDLTAVASFRLRLSRDEVAIDACTRDDIDQAAVDCFVSARYNIGPAFDRSTSIARYNARQPITLVIEALRWWRFADGRPLLDERRSCEADVLQLGLYRLQGEKFLRPRNELRS